MVLILLGLVTVHVTFVINWSPIGRNANTAQRADFVKFDKQIGFREEYKKVLEGWLVHKFYP